MIAICPTGMLNALSELVECDSEILVVGHNDISLTHLAVYKLADVVLDRFIPVKSI